MKPAIVQIRRDICKDCKLACDVRETINRADPCVACPQRVWHAMGRCEQAQPATSTAIRSLSGSIAVPSPSLFAQIFKPCSSCSKKR